MTSKCTCLIQPHLMKRGSYLRIIIGIHLSTDLMTHEPGMHAVFAKFWQNRMLAPPPPHPWEVGALISGKSWIRHCNVFVTEVDVMVLHTLTGSLRFNQRYYWPQYFQLKLIAIFQIINFFSGYILRKISFLMSVDLSEKEQILFFNRQLWNNQPVDF